MAALRAAPPDGDGESPSCVLDVLLILGRGPNLSFFMTLGGGSPAATGPTGPLRTVPHEFWVSW